MTTDTLIMLSGAVIALLPYLGFPNSWDSVFLLLLGFLVIALGITVRRRGPAAYEQRETHIVERIPLRDEDAGSGTI